MDRYQNKLESCLHLLWIHMIAKNIDFRREVAKPSFSHPYITRCHWYSRCHFIPWIWVVEENNSMHEWLLWYFLSFCFCNVSVSCNQNNFASNLTFFLIMFWFFFLFFFSFFFLRGFFCTIFVFSLLFPIFCIVLLFIALFIFFFPFCFLLCFVCLSFLLFFLFFFCSFVLFLLISIINGVIMSSDVVWLDMKDSKTTIADH